MAPKAPATDLPPDQAKLAEQATQLDEELAALRARFDQYFLGIDRKNPEKDLEDYRKRLLKLKTDFLRNTGLKFRVQSLYQKFLSYERLWLKSLKEMEEGTYARDLFRLRRKNALRDLTGDRSKDAKKDAKAKDATQKEGDEKGEPQQKDGVGKEPPKKDELWDLDADLEADLPAELFEPAPQKPAAKPLPRQKTDPALPSEMGQSAARPGATAQPVSPLPRQPSAPKPLPRQPSNPPPMPAGAKPLPRQPSTPPSQPGGVPRPLPRQPTMPPPPPPGAFGTPVSLPRQPSNPPPRPSNPGASVGTGDAGLSGDKIQRIYDAYITAKKRCKESTDGITLDAVAQSLRKQVPTLMKDHGAKSVDFKVVIKDGKAVLKAVPK